MQRCLWIALAHQTQYLVERNPSNVDVMTSRSFCRRCVSRHGGMGELTQRAAIPFELVVFCLFRIMTLTAPFPVNISNVNKETGQTLNHHQNYDRRPTSFNWSTVRQVAGLQVILSMSDMYHGNGCAYKMAIQPMLI